MAELPRVVAAFPGTGKTYAALRDMRLLDSDSSAFSWESPGVRHPRWPENYMEHVRAALSLPEYDRVLTSTHVEVRGALMAAGIPFGLVYPAPECREEYRARLARRGSPEAFVELVVDTHWDAWLEDCSAQGCCDHFVLGPGSYLTDVL